MTLHAAIEKLLRLKGRPMTTLEIADELNKNKWYEKKDASQITDFQIHGRTKKYFQLFNRNCSTVSLTGQEAIKPEKDKEAAPGNPESIKKSKKDEHYVLDLCDTILGLTSARQHKFDFLIGDTNAKSLAVRLPVDAYYDELKIVIEYRELQHTESVKFFDKADRMTISGVHRGEQRRIYDEKRRNLIPQHGLTLIEISYLDFNHSKQKRIIRNEKEDTQILKNILQTHVER